MPDEPERPPDRPSPTRGERGGPASAGAYAGMGLQFVAALLIFLFAGQWLDRRLDTSPLFLLLGVFVGAGGAFYSIYRRLMADQAREDALRRRDRPPGA